MNTAHVLHPELTVYQAEDAQRALLGAINDASTEVRLDGSATVELDTAGIQVLLAAAKEAHIRGLALHLQSSSDVLQRTLQLMGLAGRFGIEPANVARGSTRE